VAPWMSVRLPWRNTEPSYGPPGPSQEYPDPSTSHAPLSSSMGHPNRHLGEALCGRDDLHTHAPLHTFRERSQALAWAEPCLDARTYTLTHRLQRPESVDECTRMAKPVWRADLVPRTRHSEASWRVEFNAVSGRIVGGLQAHTTSFAADPQPACHSTRPDNDHEPTHGRSPVWRADPRGSYERSVARRTPRVAARLGWSFLITP
jgi:hypothetical protein